MCQSMDASNAVARVLSHAARKISGEDSKHRAGTSNTLGYGAIIEGREGAYIMANALASPSALQEIGSFDLIASPRPSPPPWDARRIIIQFAYFRNGPIFYTNSELFLVPLVSAGSVHIWLKVLTPPFYESEKTSVDFLAQLQVVGMSAASPVSGTMCPYLAP